MCHIYKNSYGQRIACPFNKKSVLDKTWNEIYLFIITKRVSMLDKEFGLVTNTQIATYISYMTEFLVNSLDYQCFEEKEKPDIYQLREKWARDKTNQLAQKVMFLGDTVAHYLLNRHLNEWLMPVPSNMMTDDFLAWAREVEGLPHLLELCQNARDVYGTTPLPHDAPHVLDQSPSPLLH
jgi:hypothetical protein